MPKVSMTISELSPTEAGDLARFVENFTNGVVRGTAGAATPSNPTGAPAPTYPPGNAVSPSNPPPVTMGNAPPPPPNGPPATPPPPAASPPPSAPPPAAPPPAPSAPPPAPPPAPAASAASGLQAEVLQGMQAWSKAGHKAAGIKRVLTKAGIASVSAQTPPQTLEWLKWAFSPQPDGSYLTPEYIESL